MIKLIIYAYFLCNVIAFGRCKLVSTTLGPIRGKLVEDPITGACYYSYEGIPYAEAPVGDLRFKAPVEKKPWTNVFDATKPGCVCPQKELFHSRREMSEDCLNFNIYTPASNLNKLRPVMVHIHAGEYKYASGNAEPVYGPQFLILEDFVVVTMNYRQGALGFLSLCNEEVPGNAGIKDVLLVLNIVKCNIYKFGGDPNKITLAGFGTGAVIAQFLMLTNKSVDLFHNVVCHSGTVLSERFIQIYPRQNSLSLAEELCLEFRNMDSFIRELRQVNAFDLVEAEEAISQKDPQRGFRKFNPFGPTVEEENPTSIITKPPLEMMRNGEILDLPLFIGFNSQEGAPILLELEEPGVVDKLNNNFELCVPADIQYPYGSEERRNLASRIKEFYLNGANISYANIPSYVNLVSDTQVTFGVDYFIRWYTEHKCSPVYYYYFDADRELNYYKKFLNITYPGAIHVDDLGYIFLTSLTKPIYQSIDVSTQRLQETMLKSLKHFALYGAPAPNSNVDCWPEAGRNRNHIITGSICETAVFHGPLPERIGFWYCVYEEYFAKDYPTYFCTNRTIC